ncbi:VOC family protein [Streptomyces uncialis]|uniref:VOC family protein n=1 Tax=Streptomyces uncialis TaxID=1048205 RepID=UPI00225AA158|nr:VOC family protein [Streptomyces uncialis]MCX4661107.1 VOC family protein [Streptomyces uncialis]
MSPKMRLSAVTLDCPDPLALMAFYQGATGLEPHTESGAEFAGLRGEHGLLIGFQRVDGHRAPTWPDPLVPQQLHLCFDVEDVDEAEARLLELGASRPEHQPNEKRWRVLIDPAGHPFCVIKARPRTDQERPADRP